MGFKRGRDWEASSYGRAAKRARTMGRRIVVARPRARRVANARTGGYLGLEHKFFDTSLSGSVVTAPTDATGGEHDPGTVLCLSAMAQGDGEENRDGRKVTITHVEVKGFVAGPVVMASADFPGHQEFFIALVQDTQTNGAQLDSENVFKNESAAAGVAAYPFRNLQFEKRFKILATRTLRRPVVTGGTDGTNTNSLSGWAVPFHIRKKLKMPVIYNGTTAVIANTTDNSLHMIAYASGVSGTPVISYNARVRFVG